jgi:hypothetical protein
MGIFWRDQFVLAYVRSNADHESVRSYMGNWKVGLGIGVYGVVFNGPQDCCIWWVLPLVSNICRGIYNDASVLGCIFICITASAPNKRSLGATNGLSQVAVSISRAVGPALSTSLFSFSVQYNILGGYGVYLLLVILVLLALVLASLLPTHLSEDNHAET